MKTNGTSTIINWALAVAVVALAIFAVQYFFKTREVRNLQSKIVEYQNKQQFLNSRSQQHQAESCWHETRHQVSHVQLSIL